MESRETQDEVIERRNWLLLEFFKKMLPDHAIRIVGDKNKPAVVMDFEEILPCYVSNFELRLLDRNDGGEVVFTIALTKTLVQPGTPVNQQPVFEKWMRESTRKQVFRVALSLETMFESQPTLFLSGWNFRNKMEKQGKYPVFSEYEPKVYFTEQKAVEVLDDLKKDGYMVKII